MNSARRIAQSSYFSANAACGRARWVRAAVARLAACTGSAVVLGSAALMELAMLLLEATLLLATVVAASAVTMGRLLFVAAEALLIRPWFLRTAEQQQQQDMMSTPLMQGRATAAATAMAQRMAQRRQHTPSSGPSPYSQTVSPLETRFLQALHASDILRYCQSDSSVVHDPTKRVRYMRNLRQHVFEVDDSYHADDDDST